MSPKTEQPQVNELTAASPGAQAVPQVWHGWEFVHPCAWVGNWDENILVVLGALGGVPWYLP